MCILRSIIATIYPKTCLKCLTQLYPSENLLCLKCTHELSYFNIRDVTENSIIEKFYGRLKLESGVVLLYYHKDEISQKLIHELKYRKNEYIGKYLGSLLAYKLKSQAIYKNIDYIVPVPLSLKKLKKRGYNQLTEFGIELGNILEIEYKPNILQKNAPTETQTKIGLIGRFKNVKTTFNLSDTKLFENKHILLIDDVISTGATIEACCFQLLKAKNIKISIACIAYNLRR